MIDSKRPSGHTGTILNNLIQSINMIAFRDFSSVGYGRPEGIDQALVEANEWLLRVGVKPLNIETLSKITGGGLTNFTSSDIGLRIWYIVGADVSAVR